MTPFHRLHRERQRLAAIRKLALEHGRRDLANHAEQYQRRYHGLAAMCRPADAEWLSGQIGSNGLGPAIDDLSKSVRHARQCARRTVMNLQFHPFADPAPFHFQKRA